MTVMIGLSTTAYSSGIGSMTEEFGVANVVGQIGMTTFNATCAIAPLFLAPLCELVGRREVRLPTHFRRLSSTLIAPLSQIYLGAYLCFTLIFILLALSPNITGILIGRALSGLFGCVGTILVGGTLADICTWAVLPRTYIGVCERDDSDNSPTCREHPRPRSSHVDLHLQRHFRYGRCAHLLRLHRPGYWLAVD